MYADEVEKSVLNNILTDFSYETFKAMQEQWLVKGRMLWFAYGNLTKDQANQIVNQAIQF